MTYEEIPEEPEEQTGLDTNHRKATLPRYVPTPGMTCNSLTPTGQRRGPHDQLPNPVSQQDSTNQIKSNRVEWEVYHFMLTVQNPLQLLFKISIINKNMILTP